MMGAGWWFEHGVLAVLGMMLILRDEMLSRRLRKLETAANEDEDEDEDNEDEGDDIANVWGSNPYRDQAAMPPKDDPPPLRKVIEPQKQCAICGCGAHQFCRALIRPKKDGVPVDPQPCMGSPKYACPKIPHAHVSCENCGYAWLEEMP